MIRRFTGSFIGCCLGMVVLALSFAVSPFADEEPQDVLSITASPDARVWQIDNPLFQELLTTQQPPLPGEAGFTWTHPFMVDRLRSAAAQYGFEYSLEETGNLFKDLNVHPIQESVNMGKILSENRYPQAKALVKLNWYRARGEGMPTVTSDGQTVLFAPKNREKYLQETEQLLKDYGSEIWGVFAGDEIVLKQRNAFFAIHECDLEKHPYIKDIDADIRNRFGLGKYGMPTSRDDHDPYKWMAMSLWLDEQVCLLLADLREIIDRVAPHVVLVGDDPVSGFRTFDFAHRGKYCDIVSYQVSPQRNPMRQEFAFFTKYMVDLSGKSVYPCAHIENYIVSLDAEETLEILSQVFRVGGRGFHYYPSDVKGVRRKSQDTGYCRIGDPGRWAAFEYVLRTIRDLPLVQLPEQTKTMILVEPSTLSTVPITQIGARTEYATCFEFLGSHAGSWFHFVHSGQLERGEVSLSDYKVVYVPMAKYFKSSLADQLMEYVNNGGTVVCADPEVFSFAADKDSLPPDALEKLGLQTQPGTASRRSLTITDNTYFPGVATSEAFSLGVDVQAFRGTGDQDWKALALFEEGSPAIARKTLGKGTWVQFAFQPFQIKLIESPQMRALFKSLQQHMGEPTDLDIWRFRFPTPDNLPKAPEGRCLTGNGVFWQQNEPVSVGGDGVKGKTVWTKNPVGVSQGEMAFTQSKLFDRRSAVQAQNDKAPAVAFKNWTYQWDGAEPFELQVLFDEKQPVDRLSLWYSGTLPDLEVIAVSEDSIGVPHRVSSANAGEDVLRLDVSFDGASVEGALLRFAERPAGSSALILCELELWAKE